MEAFSSCIEALTIVAREDTSQIGNFLPIYISLISNGYTLNVDSPHLKALRHSGLIIHALENLVVMGN